MDITYLSVFLFVIVLYFSPITAGIFFLFFPHSIFLFRKSHPILFLIICFLLMLLQIPVIVAGWISVSLDAVNGENNLLFLKETNTYTPLYIVMLVFVFTGAGILRQRSMKYKYLRSAVFGGIIIAPVSYFLVIELLKKIS